MTNTSRRWMWLSLVSTLVLGMSLGVLVDRLVLDGRDDRTERSRSQRDHREGLMARLDRELGLSEEQQESLEKLLAGNRERARAFMKQTRNSYAQLREEFRSEIRILLSPDQRKRFDAMLSRENKERNKKNR